MGKISWAGRAAGHWTWSEGRGLLHRWSRRVGRGNGARAVASEEEPAGWKPEGDVQLIPPDLILRRCCSCLSHGLRRKV